MLDLHTLNPQQRQAVETMNGPVLILAGAGTGKTRVITFRIAHMVQRGIAPDHILAVTFTNKASREMLERVNELVPRRRASDGEKPPRPTVCTFHSLCVRILRQHIEKLGYKRNFVIYDESEQVSTVKKILSHISAKGEKTDPRAVLAMLSKFRNGGSRAAAFNEPSVAALAEHVSKRYESALRACNAVDFDDLILLTLRLFNEHPDALDACRAKYRYVMVDEYQDTNAAQFQLVHALTREHRNLCVVGDDDQSIYGWRGAEVANLLDLEKHFPEVKVVKLEQNYRSTNTILSAANAVIKNNPRRRGKNLWSQKGQGDKIALHAFDNDEEEARTVVEEIEFKRIGRRVPWSEQAILFRTNLQSRPIETELRKAGVRYHLIGGQSFFDRREIRDFLAYLKVFQNPHDDVSLLRIANTPARGLSDVTMERLLAASQERSSSVFTAMRHTDVQESFQQRTREAIREFVNFIEHHRAQLVGESADPSPGLRPSSPHPMGRGQGEGSVTLGAWATSFLDEIRYWDELRRSEKDVEAAGNRVRNLRDLMVTMDGGSRRGDEADLPGAGSFPPPHVGGHGALSDRLETFLEDITLDADREEEKENTGDAVTLITTHSCKGLEFPHVHLVGVEDGLLPHARSKVEGTLDEERRLFYVAITRAKETLAISHCGARRKYGQLMPCHPSPFLKELPAELVEDMDAKSRQPVTKEASKDLFAAMRAAAQ
ncbi:MAG: UvrD-helicase domain-containing protein [Verrucomicrobia bacterium]|nr:UvrD-helicase domain-containing protein [Verrucomicrobiota bacterium]